MFYPHPPQPTQTQPQPELKPEPSIAFKTWQSLQKTFFLVVCGCGSLAATNLIRVHPAYFWLYVILIVVAIASLLFFPNKRPGSLAMGIGIVLAAWEFIAAFKFQPQHWLLVVGVIVVIFLILGALGGRK